MKIISTTFSTILQFDFNLCRSDQFNFYDISVKLGKRNELNLTQKISLISQANGKSQRQLAEQFRIGKTQVINEC